MYPCPEGASLVPSPFPCMPEGMWTGAGPPGRAAVTSPFSLNLFLLSAMVLTVTRNRTAAQITDRAAPRQAWPEAAPPFPALPTRLRTQSGRCVCWCVREEERWWVNLKFNLLSFSHREKEWEQVSKNSPACQNW